MKPNGEGMHSDNSDGAVEGDSPHATCLAFYPSQVAYPQWLPNTAHPYVLNRPTLII